MAFERLSAPSHKQHAALLNDDSAHADERGSRELLLNLSPSIR